MCGVLFFILPHITKKVYEEKVTNYSINNAHVGWGSYCVFLCERR
jgi:hypothetical protein